MGVRRWMQRQKFIDPVPGTFEVQSLDVGKTVGSHAELDASGVLSAPGLDLFTAQFHGMAPTEKLPAPGLVLPVTVDRAQPAEFRIEWDQVQAVPDAVPQAQHLPVTGDGVDPPHAHSPAPDWDRATATILISHHAKVPPFAEDQAPGGIVDLWLNVRLDDGYEYGTKIRVAFSSGDRRAKATEKGTELPVLVDPNDPNRVVIDIDRIPHW
ncbi:MAG TPA: DUF3592 domain-containing protein [Pseudonocardiaceae bacterium]|nr:DUF3592 domain-containing protein [Pseudonocardiaceae bacterium]